MLTSEGTVLPEEMTILNITQPWDPIFLLGKDRVGTLDPGFRETEQGLESQNNSSYKMKTKDELGEPWKCWGVREFPMGSSVGR